jgi:hypothetical protein
MFVKIRANSCLPDLQFIRTDPNSTARSESLIFPRSSFHSASFRVVCGSTSVVSFSFSCVSHISRLKISVFIRPHPWLKFWDHRRSRRTGPGRLADGYRTGSTLTIARQNAAADGWTGTGGQVYPTPASPRSNHSFVVAALLLHLFPRGRLLLPRFSLSVLLSHLSRLKSYLGRLGTALGRVKIQNPR